MTKIYNMPKSTKNKKRVSFKKALCQSKTWEEIKAMQKQKRIIKSMKQISILKKYSNDETNPCIIS